MLSYSPAWTLGDGKALTCQGIDCSSLLLEHVGESFVKIKFTVLMSETTYQNV